MCSRVCHDLISPVGAIVNGLEVMEDDADEETKTFAIDLIKKSATHGLRPAAVLPARLRCGGLGRRAIDTGDAESVARGMIEDDKIKLTWKLPRVLLPKNRVKLLLNMLVLAGGTIPRGGSLAVEPVGEGDTMGFKITADRHRMPASRRRCRAWSPDRRKIRSTPTPSSRSIPACWRGPAG